MRWLYARVFTFFEIAVIALIFGVAVYLYRIDTQVTINAAKQNALEHGAHASTALIKEHASTALIKEIAVLETIATSVAVTASLLPDKSEEDFSRLAEGISQGRQGIRNLAYAPDLVVRFVYPKQGNSSVIGLDYRQPSKFTLGADTALQTNRSVLIGPVDLLQGGRALIMRVPFRPIGANGAKGQGLVSLVLDVDKMIEGTDLMAEIMDVSHELSMAAYAGKANASEDGLVFGSVSSCHSQALLVALPVMDTTWTLCVAPKDGWPARGSNGKLIIALAILASLTTIGVFAVVNRLRMRESKAKAQLWDAIEAINDGFVLFDKDDRLVLCNSRYREIYSASAEMIRPGATFREIVEYGVWRGAYAEAVGNEENWVENRMATHRDPHGELEQQLADGSWVKISERKTSEGGTVGFRVDISDLKRAQHEAEASTRAITEFLTNINHEIRTPLSVIVGFIKFLAQPEALGSHKALEKVLDEGCDPNKTREAVAAFTSEVKNYANRIEKSSAHLLRLVQDTLDMSKVTRGDYSLNLETLELGSLVKECAGQFMDQANKKGIDLQVDAPSVEIVADPSCLRRILFNLVDNALKFTDSGYVKIWTESDEDAVVIKVADSGPGIAREHRQSVFEKFRQIDGSVTRKHSGTGLGLAISAALVKLHGGEIWVEGADEGGSVFCVRLPQAQLLRMVR